MQKFYFDNAATTQIDPAVILAMKKVDQDYYGNPSSIHSFGQKSKAIIEKSRRSIAEILGADGNEIIFTSGGSESNNFALIGAAFANREKGNHIITTAVEHPSVLNTCKFLEKTGFDISYLPLRVNSGIDLEHLNRMITANTILISMMHTNNETGMMFPVVKIKPMLEKRKILIFCDAVQAFGKIDFNVNKLGVDLLSIAAHKIHGPKGIGALYIRTGTNIQPIIHGGSQEFNRRAGTENVTAIVGFGEAAEQMIISKSKRIEIKEIRDTFEKEIKAMCPDCKINSEGMERINNISNINFPGVALDSMLVNLDLQGIACSSGSACSSGVVTGSHVLESMGYEKDRAQKSIRFSFSRFNTLDEVNKVAEIISSVYKRLREQKSTDV